MPPPKKNPNLQEGDYVIMVQEYADGGDLFSMLQRYGGRLSERAAVAMVLEPFLRVLQVASVLGGGGRFWGWGVEGWGWRLLTKGTPVAHGTAWAGRA
jgi:hypothetical protein